METVFEHHPTAQELEALFGSVRMAEWLRDHGASQDGHWGKILCLLARRGEKKKAKDYLARIQDLEFQLQIASLIAKTH